MNELIEKIELDDPVLEVRRCPKCRALIYIWPCIACSLPIRDERKNRHRRRCAREREEAFKYQRSLSRWTQLRAAGEF